MGDPGCYLNGSAVGCNTLEPLLSNPSGATVLCQSSACMGPGTQVVDGPGGTTQWQQWVPWYVDGHIMTDENGALLEASLDVIWHWVDIDTPVGTDIWHQSAGCPHCGQYFTQSYNAVKAGTAYTAVGTAGAFGLAEFATSSVGDLLFARSTGLLNANDFLRIGWSWYGRNVLDFLPAGGMVFRIVVGCPDCMIHWHLRP